MVELDVAPEKRPLAHFPKDIWGDRFVNFTPQDNLSSISYHFICNRRSIKSDGIYLYDMRMESYAKRVEPLKEEVKIMLMDESMDPTNKMSLIDAVERLGVSYYYANEINELLDQIFNAFAANSFQNNCDLYNTSTQFRIFRQHGFAVPCDVFNKYTDEEGKFKETLRNDLRGMLSLYEAAHLRLHDENILDEALDFTTNFLNSIKTSSKVARHALKQPLHMRIPRVEIRHAIDSYEEDEESPNLTLLRLAKMDYNKLQLLHCQELSEMLRWWKDLDLATKLPYARNRCVETHFWGIAMYFEPQYSLGRKLFAKCILIISIIDDTFDAYGTFEELQLLTQAFERWDLSAMEQLPADYLKVVYEFVYNLCDEFAKEMTEKGKPHSAQFVKDRLMDLIRSYMVESKWLKAGYVPTFEEFMVNGKVTSTAPLLITASLMGMDEIKDVKPFEQILQVPKAINTPTVVARLMNDIVSRKEEQASEHHVVSSVECYMKEFDMSREEVVQIFNTKLEDVWKDLNEEFLRKPTNNSLVFVADNDNDHLPVPVLKRALNFARMVDAFYKVIDGYTYSAKVIKDDVIEAYSQSIPI